MNMFKKNGGFTLVELIVVIAILAILAAVAVPAYSGYINKANDAADITALGAIKTAAFGACATTGEVTQIEVTTTNDGTVSAVKVYIGKDDATTTGDDRTIIDDIMNAETEIGKDFDLFMNDANVTLKGTLKGGATWTSATSEWAAPGDDSSTETTAPTTGG